MRYLLSKNDHLIGIYIYGLSVLPKEDSDEIVRNPSNSWRLIFNMRVTDYAKIIKINKFTKKDLEGELLEKHA